MSHRQPARNPREKTKKVVREVVKITEKTPAENLCASDSGRGFTLPENYLYYNVTDRKRKSPALVTAGTFSGGASAMNEIN